MDKQMSMTISAKIGGIIAAEQPKIEYTETDVRREFASYSDEELAEMREIGLVDGDSLSDFEKFYVIREFCAELGLSSVDDDGRYTLELFKNARMLDAEELENDPFIKNIKIKDASEGKILLTTSSYERGEIFQYDMPELSARLVVPKLGFFKRRVAFPALYEGMIPWVSVCPSEINSMRTQMERAHGKVLVLGLGLGYYPYIISQKDCVESITIVELQPTVINVFKDQLLPQFDRADKIRIVCADAIEYMKSVKNGEYDFCFADIWEGAVDGADLYRKIRAHEQRLDATEFTYWIEEQIRAYLEEDEE